MYGSDGYWAISSLASTCPQDWVTSFSAILCSWWWGMIGPHGISTPKGTCRPHWGCWIYCVWLGQQEFWHGSTAPVIRNLPMTAWVAWSSPFLFLLPGPPWDWANPFRSPHATACGGRHPPLSSRRAAPLLFLLKLSPPATAGPASLMPAKRQIPWGSQGGSKAWLWN